MTALFAFAFVGTAHAQGVGHDQMQQQVQAQQAAPAPNAAFSLQADGTSHPASMDDTKPMSPAPRPNNDCVGPVSFCNIYFGS
jgi:hypothetical protein